MTRIRGLRCGRAVKLRSSELARLICLVAALGTFLLLPGVHVLVHEHEAAQAKQVRALQAARALQGAHVHPADCAEHTHAAAAHAPVPYQPQHSHQHQGKNNAGHGRDAPEHFAAALTLAAALPLIPPATLHLQLIPCTLIDRLTAAAKVRSHATRASPAC